MSVLNRLRTLFRSANMDLSSGSVVPPDGERFLEQLGASDLFVIAASQSQGIDAKSMTGDQLHADIRRELERDQAARQQGYALFVYTAEGGERRLPLFTSNEHAQAFCGEYSKERSRVYPFMVLQTSGKFVARIDPASCDAVVLNDKSPDERPLTPDELSAARRMWG